MSAMNAERLSQRLLDLELITPSELQDIWGTFGRRNVEGEEFLQALVRREALTNWQVDRLKKGDNTGFYYGDYKVLYLVGAGTFARVYRAVRKGTDEVVALKVLRNRFSEDAEKTAHFMNEGKMGLELRHPNIVPILDVSSVRTTHYLAMEFVEGGSLREFVRVRGRIPPDEATRLIMDITNGIRYAWQKGISHRDLKMTNVLVASSGTAKVVDFGLAAGHTAEGNQLRTVDYAGLEKASGAKKDDARSDIFFLGCLYYNMLSGQPPLSQTRDRVERIAKQRFINITPINQVVADLPAAVVTVVNRAIELKPERRYQTPSEMLIDLRHLYERIEGKDFKTRERSAVANTVSDKSSVMIAESDPNLQDKLREAFKKFGFRVMLTRDPKRAVDRFYDPQDIPDSLILDAETTGEAAIHAFNQFANEERTQDLPAVLLLSPNQKHLAEKANVNEYRRILYTPIKLRNLRDTLESLLGHVAASAEQEG